MADNSATTDMGRKVGAAAAVPLSVEGAGFPSNTMSPGPRPTFVPSGMVHPTVWLQYTNLTDRQTDRTDNGIIAQDERFSKKLENGLLIGQYSHSG